MMPIDEPLVNHARRSGSMEQQHRMPRHDTSSYVGDPDGNDPTNLLQNTLSIQSMLRNTTETGNVAQFPNKQYRVPSAMSDVTIERSLRPRIGSRNFSQPLPYHYQGPYPGNGCHIPKVLRHGPSSPRTGASLHPPSPASYRGPSRGPSMDEYRSYSMTQSSYTTHSLTNRHPYVQGAHYQNRGQMQNFRSRSPFAYPTRLKRPGYRPSSPALSLNRSVPGSDPDHGQSSRTASPASMYNMNRVPTPWQQLVNRSDPMLRYYPPVPSSRASTPKPAPSLGTIPSSARLSQAQTTYPGAWPESPALTTPPLFYDYSEAFEEQTHIHRISVSVVTSPSPRAEDGQNEYFEHSQSPELDYPAELPSENPPAPTVELHDPSPVDRHSQLRAKHQPDTSKASNQEQDQSTEAPDSSSHNLKPPESLSISPNSSKDRENSKTVTLFADGSSAAAQQNIAEGAGFRMRRPSVQENQKFAGDQHRSEHDSSSPAASMYSVQSSVPLENHDDSTAPTSGADTGTASPQEPPRTPIPGPHPFESSHRLAHGETSETSKTSASITSVRNEYPEIVAPTPERSIASLSNRDRFSKILGLDEALLEIDGLTALTNCRGSKTSYTASPISKPHRSLQQSISPTPTTNHTIAEEMGSDSEHELTDGLMETFGRANKSATEDNVIRRSASLSPRAVRDTLIPLELLLRKSPGMETPTPTNVRLSHRKTVINRGQNVEAKTVAVCQPSSIEEEKDSETSHVADSKELHPIHINNNPSGKPKPSPSIKAFTPPTNTSKSNLPFAFTPLIHASSDEDSLAELEATTAFYLRKHDTLGERGGSPPPDSRPHLERMSTASPDGSRPWNLDASYPWDDDGPPKLDVVMPLPDRDSQQNTERLPKFRLRIHRASSSNASKLTKKHRSSEDTTSSVIASSVGLLTSASFRRRPRPSLSIAPGQSNSSHDIIRTSPMQTRFVESFEHPLPTSPEVNLLPPSPALDVRSFFSDDSSQARPKGSLRKRFSDFRARNSRSNSVDHVPGYDRGLLNSAFGLSRDSGRSSRQSQITAGAASHGSPTGRLRWNILGKIRTWFSRREENIRDWTRKRRHMTQADRNARTPLYAGV